MIIALLVAALVGYLAGRLMKVNKPWYFNVILGLLGGAVGNFLFGIIGMGAYNLFGSILVSTIGSCIVIWLYRKFIK